MGSLQTWSSNEFFSAAVLKQRKKASVKNPNTEADPVPFALFWKDFQQSPTGDADGVWSFSKFKKEDNFDQRMPFQQLPWISSLFHSVFQHKKVCFHSETTRTLYGLPKCRLLECQANFSKICLLCFIKAVKNNKLGSVKNSRDFER
jgi:hypothetical protein